MISKDKEIIDKLLDDEELSEETLDYIKSRWGDSEFRNYYNSRINKSYDKGIKSYIANYTPFIILIILIIIGILIIL